MKLTKRLVDAARYEGNAARKQWDIRWDDEVRGFGLRIYPSGRKTFVIFYRIAGRLRLMTLGPCDVLTVDEARKDAKQKLAQILRNEDPLEKKQKLVRGPTIGDLCKDYMERHAVPHKKSWRDDQRLIRCNILPTWENRKVSQIKRDDVALLHHRLGHRSVYEANRTLALLSKMFELARQWGFLEDSAANPARGIKKFPEEKRSRYLSPDELPRLVKSINEDPNVYVRGLFYLYLLTGLRKSELLNAKWENFDERKAILHIPHTKSGRAFHLPLSPPALAVFSTFPRIEGNPYIFASLSKSASPLTSIHKNWLRIRRRARLEDVRIHDLRRTVASWIAQSEKNLHLVSRLLNHADISTTAKVYAHLAEDQVRGAIERHGKAVLNLTHKRLSTVRGLR